VTVWDDEVVDEQLVRVDRRAAQLLDLLDDDAGAVEVGEEEGEPGVLRVRVSNRILSATCAVLIQTLRPLTTQSPPRRTARVRRLVVSSPESGSLTPNATFIRPATMSGRLSCFISGEPCLTTTLVPKTFMCTVLAALRPPPRAMASIITAASEMPRPDPPYSVGMATPSQP